MPIPGRRRRLPEAGSAALITAATLGLGADSHSPEFFFAVSALAAAQPYVTAVWTWLDDVFDRAATRRGEPAARLVEELMSSPEKQELFAEVFGATRSAASEEKRRVLAAALAAGASAAPGDIALTRSLLIVRAITDLEAPHMAMLAKLNEPPLKTAAPAAGSAGSSQGLMWGINGWRSSTELRAIVKDSMDLLVPILATLERHGLVEQTEPEGLKFKKHEASWRLTPHGRFLMEDLLGDADK
ncbi:MAG: hypothetical protein WCF24_12460 [Acidimicrobiales bacterium]